jgi:hypothetical protein
VVALSSPKRALPRSPRSRSRAGGGSSSRHGPASATSTLTNVSTSTTSVQLLAANAGRLGAAVYNDSAVVLYLKLGTTASSTSYTVAMAAGSYYEVPFSYNGRIDGVLASGTGTARVTELS